MDQLDDLLRRYRPAAPPPTLRDRILAADRSISSNWPGAQRVRRWVWPLAAAAAAALFYVLADRQQREWLSDAADPTADREAALVEMTALLGSDESARLQAEHVMAAIDRARVESPLPGSQPLAEVVP